VSLPTWEVFSEDKYHQPSKGKCALPTMAIATIKYDDHNRPKCAKYCLVALGNLDYHTWSKEDTKAPVFSQLELRLLTSLSVKANEFSRIMMSNRLMFSHHYQRMKNIFSHHHRVVFAPNLDNAGVNYLFMV
jgi:hypothetical protein